MTDHLARALAAEPDKRADAIIGRIEAESANDFLAMRYAKQAGALSAIVHLLCNEIAEYQPPKLDPEHEHAYPVLLKYGTEAVAVVSYADGEPGWTLTGVYVNGADVLASLRGSVEAEIEDQIWDAISREEARAE